MKYLVRLTEDGPVKTFTVSAERSITYFVGHGMQAEDIC
jgi:hypothetical protein